MPVPATHTIKQNSRAAQNAARGKMAEFAGDVTLSTMDELGGPKYLIYVYNMLEMEHVVEQPPTFPHFIIPKCPKGEKFSVTLLPPMTKLPFEKPGSTEIYYKNEDGRKAAMSLLNPAAFPGTEWRSQLMEWESIDQFGNNLNAYGVFWSLTKPEEEEKLEGEFKLFREQINRTMTMLVKNAEILAAQGPDGQRLITPRMHFAMDYLKRQAPWHMPMVYTISCPTCGEQVNEGLVYHKNAFGEKCIIDEAKYDAMQEKLNKKAAKPSLDDNAEELVGATAGPAKPARAKRAPAAK